MTVQRLAVPLAIAIALLTVACGGSAGTGQGSGPTTVHVGILGSVSDAGVIIAQAKGYFKEQGINAQFQRFQSGANMTPAVGRGQLDVAAGAPSAGLFNAMARDIKVRLVADKGYEPPGNGYDQYLVRKDLWDSGQVRGPADLKGRTVSLASRGIPPEHLLDMYLRTGGLTVKDVKITPLSFPDAATALGNHSVDAADLIAPFPTVAQAKGAGVPLVSTDQVSANHQLGVVMYSEDFAKKTDVARRFMLAYLKGARDHDDAFIKKTASPQERAQLVQILAKNTSVTDTSLYDKMVMPVIEPNGTLHRESLKSDQDYFLQAGEQKNRVDLDANIDTNYVDWAVQKLGKYTS